MSLYHSATAMGTPRIYLKGLKRFAPDRPLRANAERVKHPLLERRPRWIARSAGGGYAAQVAAGDIHRIKARLPRLALRFAGKHDDTAIGCPSRPLIKEGRGQQTLFTAVG